MVFILLVIIALAIFPTPASAIKYVYNDQETGKEVWRMSDYAQDDWTLYYHHHTISPDGRFLFFGTQGRQPYIYSVRTDGTNERPVGDAASWSSYGVGFSGDILHGWWSADGKKYYVHEKLTVIDVDRYASGALPSQYISQISSAYAENFYYPMSSPDGKRLVGTAHKEDVSSGTTMKMIDVDGTDYVEFAPSFPDVDVSHGWIGNTAVWALDRSEDIPYLYSSATGQYLGNLKVAAMSGFDHVTISASGYFIGGREGTVGSRYTGFANTDWTTSDAAARQAGVITSMPSGGGEHNNFSPDRKWTMTVDFYSANEGLIMAYPMPGNTEATQPVKVARFRDPNETGYFGYANWSPDGAKIVYYTDFMNVNGGTYPGGRTWDDVYMAVFKKPDPPRDVSAVVNGGTTYLRWRSAFSRRETGTYEIFSAPAQNGPWTLAVSVGEDPTTTSLLLPGTQSTITASQTTIPVASTANFPSSGVIEIFGLSSERPTELVRYTGISGNTFTGCTRGYGGTAAAEHYHEAFVWLSRFEPGVIVTANQNTYYRIRSVERSGLAGVDSAIVTAGSPPPTASLTPAPTGSINPDGNADGRVDGLDYVIWLNHYNQAVTGAASGDFNSDGRANGLDYVIWLNNYGRNTAHTPTPTSGISPTAMSVPSRTPTAIPSRSPTPTRTPTASPTRTPTPTTPIASPTQAAGTFNFISWSDTENISNGSSGLPTLAQLSAQAAALNPEFTIYNGDAEGGQGLSGWHSALNGYTNNGMSDKSFVVRGNGNVGDSTWSTFFDFRRVAGNVGAANFCDITDTVANGVCTRSTSTTPNRSYSFDYGNSRFIGLDATECGSTVTSAMVTWSAARIAEAEALGRTHVFLFMHGPIWYANNHKDCTVPTNLVTLINSHPIVTASFHGHEHIKTVLHFGNGDSRLPITQPFRQIISGGAGGDTYSCNSSRLNSATDWCSAFEGFANVTVSGASIKVDFYGQGNTSIVKSVSFSK